MTTSRVLKTYLLLIVKILLNKVKLLNHNNVSILDYPETEWFIVPFPKQKNIPYNSDNLATVNRYKFVDDDLFIRAKSVAERRWNMDGSHVRDISWRLHVMLWCVSQSLKNANLSNDIFVECGTGKGYMAAGICEYFRWDNDKPVFYLVDSFKATMPNDDGEQIQNGKKLFAYAEGDTEIREYFRKYKNISLITGTIPDILIEIPNTKHIKFLHIDLNNAQAELHALQFFVDRFRSGTVILFDDYGGPGGDKQASVHEQFSIKYNKPLLVLPTGQGLIIW